MTGPASIIQAIAQGRQAAAAVDKYLGGKGVIAEEPVVDSPRASNPRQQGKRAPMSIRLNSDRG